MMGLKFEQTRQCAQAKRSDYELCIVLTKAESVFQRSGDQKEFVEPGKLELQLCSLGCRHHKRLKKAHCLMKMCEIGCVICKDFWCAQKADNSVPSQSEPRNHVPLMICAERIYQRCTVEMTDKH